MTAPALRNPRLVTGLDAPTPLDWSDYSLDAIPIPSPKYTPQELAGIMDSGVERLVAGQVEPAMECFREVLLYERTNPKALYFSAIALSMKGHKEADVLAMMEQAASKLPNVPDAQYNLGILLSRMGMVEQARQRFELCLKGKPNGVQAMTSLAGCWLNLGEAGVGRFWIEQACRTRATTADDRYAQGFANLTLGRYGEGWSCYRARWENAAFLIDNRRNFGGARHWNHKPIPGKVLYVHTEQGAGDVIMMSRFLRRIAEKSQAQTIILEVGAALVDHLAQVQGVDYVIASNTAIPPGIERVDCYLPMMSVAQFAGCLSPEKITHAGGWLEAREEVTLPEKRLPRIGIAWAGSKAHKNDRYRSILWDQWRDVLLRDPRLAGKVEWVSVQVGERARDMDDGGDGVLDATPWIQTFGQTVAVCRQLDLLVSVDTATVHACASLTEGPETWMLTPAAPDWRWGLSGETTPWYDRVRLIRQTKCEDWETPLRETADRLHAWLSQRGTV